MAGPRVRHTPTVLVWAARLSAGLLVGLVTGLLGTGVHAWEVVRDGVGWPVGLGLAVALVVAADLALLCAVPRSPVAFADAAGRALVLVPAFARGPGGDVVLSGGGAGETWLLVAVLVPALAGPPLAAAAAVRRARSARAATLRTG